MNASVTRTVASLLAMRKRIWWVYGAVLLLAPLVYWIASFPVWLCYGAVFTLCLGADLLIAQRIYARRDQKVEAVIVGFGVVLFGFGSGFMLLMAARLAFFD